MKGRTLHFIGIGGAGMSGLALVCDQLGARVSGSDRAESSYTRRLREAGIEVAIGHDAANLPAGAEVVVSTAIGRGQPRAGGGAGAGRGDHPPRRAARRALRAQAADRCLGHPRQDDDDGDGGLGDAGARPRAGLLPRRRAAGRRPGGRAANSGWGEGKWAVAEADESDASFLRLEPEIAVVTNLEMDHHSRWGSLAELRAGLRASSPRRRGGVALPAGGGLDRLAEGRDGSLLRPRGRRGRRSSSWRSRGATTCSTLAPPWRRIELAGADLDARGAGARRLPGGEEAAGAEGEPLGGADLR